MKPGIMRWNGTCGRQIGPGGVKREKASAVLQGESPAQNNDVRSKVVGGALDHGRNIAFAIDDGEVGGVAVGLSCCIS